MKLRLGWYGYKKNCVFASQIVYVRSFTN